MVKRVIIVHRWSGNPETDWYPWLKQELEGRGIEVLIPAMPNPDHPVIEERVPYLANLAGQVDEGTWFVGHSIGCQTILRYLEGLPADVKIGGAVFVAGWFTLMNLEPEDEPIAAPWIEQPIDFTKVTRHTTNFTAIFSDNDPVVPPDNKQLFEDRLRAKTFVEHAKGHFTQDDGVTELPIVIETLFPNT